MSFEAEGVYFIDITSLCAHIRITKRNSHTLTSNALSAFVLNTYKSQRSWTVKWIIEKIKKIKGVNV